MSSFYKEEVGAVLSCSIDKYIYVAINKKFDGKTRISYSRTEEVNSVNQIEHPIVKESMLHLGIRGGIEIASLADIPSAGTGLGSSSSFTVGLLNALYAYSNQYVSKTELAEAACNIEINCCNEPIGKQDQYAAAIGGINFIRFHQDETVSVAPIICKPSTLTELQDSTLVFYTGITRNASSILAEQSKGLLIEKQKKTIMRRMVELAHILKKELENNKLENFGPILNENWRLKKQLANNVTNDKINALYDTGIAHGATGGKLLGAGAGGFLMFYAPKHTHNKIISSLKCLKLVNFKCEYSGAQIIFYQPLDRR